MSQLIINVGAAPNDGTGDPLRTAYIKCNSNFGELYSRAQPSVPGSLVGSIGDQAGMYAYNATFFYYCFQDYDGSSEIWAEVTNIGNVSLPQINNGNSRVEIGSADSDITVTVDGVSNVAVFKSNVSTFTNVAISGQLVTVGNSSMGHVIPSVDSSYDLGSPDNKWRSLYVSGNTIYLGNAEITANNSSITLTSGTGAEFTISGNSAADTVGSFGEVQATGNIVGDAVVANTITSTGNVVATEYFVGTLFGNITGNFVIPGATTEVVYNSDGVADASSDFVYDNSIKRMSVNGNIVSINTAADTAVFSQSVTAGSLSVSGNISGSNALAITGNITGGNLSVVRLVGTSASISGNVTAGNVSGTLLTGTLTTPAQTAITSVGTLASLSVTGNVSAGNVSGTLLTGTLITAAQPNITSLGTLASLLVAGNVSAGNVNGGQEVNATLHSGTTVSVTGNVSGSNIIGTNLVGTLTTAAQPSITSVGTLSGLTVNGNISAFNIAGTITTSSQPNIQTLGTLTSLAVTGNLSSGNISTTDATATTITTSSIIKSGSNGVGNIGSSTSVFNTVHAKATSAQYADLAEMYAADADYEPGTVVCFGGAAEITECNIDSSPLIAGVVSTAPAYIMNSGLVSEHVVAVALTGRVPCRVVGPVKRGQMMVSAGDGCARAELKPDIGTVIGKALSDFDGTTGIIEVVVGRL